MGRRLILEAMSIHCQLISLISLTGPEYWELINPGWSLCNKGKRQSPIDIRPEQLLFDPSLESIQVIGNKVRRQSPVVSSNGPQNFPPPPIPYPLPSFHYHIFL